ncbi:MAG: hypothetical protein ACFFB7_03320, partial [Candidatus Sifarchaeia archaeon]
MPLTITRYSVNKDREHMKLFVTRRRVVLLVLALMVLVNIVARYPADHTSPHGSDTYLTLDLGRALETYGQANWILHPLSYVGLYPLSYPSGTSFIYAELVIMTETSWN